MDNEDTCVACGGDSEPVDAITRECSECVARTCLTCDGIGSVEVSMLTGVSYSCYRASGGWAEAECQDCGGRGTVHRGTASYSVRQRLDAKERVK